MARIARLGALALCIVAAASTVRALPETAVPDCKSFDSEIARADEARRTAQADSDNAWKAVVPFVVLARKASAKSALDEADKKLAALKAQAAACAAPHVFQLTSRAEP